MSYSQYIELYDVHGARTIKWFKLSFKKIIFEKKSWLIIIISAAKHISIFT